MKGFEKNRLFTSWYLIRALCRERGVSISLSYILLHGLDRRVFRRFYCRQIRYEKTHRLNLKEEGNITV